MPKARLNDLYVQPGSNEHARVVVPEIVDSESFRQTVDSGSSAAEAFLDRVRGNGSAISAYHDRSASPLHWHPI
jgi:hypothetical protein